jgi:hypothetical protein
MELRPLVLARQQALNPAQSFSWQYRKARRGAATAVWLATRSKGSRCRASSRATASTYLNLEYHPGSVRRPGGAAGRAS